MKIDCIRRDPSTHKYILYKLPTYTEWYIVAVYQQIYLGLGKNPNLAYLYHHTGLDEFFIIDDINYPKLNGDINPLTKTSAQNIIKKGYINSPILLYKTYIRPILTYADPVWMTAVTTKQKYLEAVQRRAIRIMADVTRYASLRTLDGS